MEQETHHYAATTNEASVLAETIATNGTHTNVNFGNREIAYLETDATSSTMNEHQHQAPPIHLKFRRTSQNFHHHSHHRHHTYTTLDHRRRKSIHGTERAVKSDEARKEKTEKARPVKKRIEMYSLHTMQVAMETGKLAIPPR